MNMTLHNGSDDKVQETLADVIEHVLKDECSLSAITRDYRWNVTGPHVSSLNHLFHEQRRQLDHWVGKIVERAKWSGFGARASLEKDVELAAGDAMSHANVPPGTMVADLLARHEAMSLRLRNYIRRLGDPGTTELFLRIVEFHETTAWMLRMIERGPDPKHVA
jgi:DNA-binding ferritin-like protein